MVKLQSLLWCHSNCAFSGKGNSFSSIKSDSNSVSTLLSREINESTSSILRANQAKLIKVYLVRLTKKISDLPRPGSANADFAKSVS